MKKIEMYTDGGCSPNPGVGGAAAVLRYVRPDNTEVVKEYYVRRESSTSNQMELEAVLLGLSKLLEPCNIVVLTDSNLLIGWLQKGWKRNHPECQTLLLQIETEIMVSGHMVQYVKVLGHSGHRFNERCHSLVEQARKEKSDG